MTDPQIARLEEQFKVKLPAKYVELVRRLRTEVNLKEITTIRYPLIPGGGLLTSENRFIREQTAHLCREPADVAQKWPDFLFVCGIEKTVRYLIDTREPDPPILQILESTKKLEPCAKYSTLDALYEYALTHFRKEAAKARKKAKEWGEEIPERPAVTATTIASAATEKPEQCEVDELAALLAKGGFVLTSPQRRHPIAEVLADVVPVVPAALHALYTLCDGGESKSCACGFPLFPRPRTWQRTSFVAPWAFFPLRRPCKGKRASCAREVQ